MAVLLMATLRVMGKIEFSYEHKILRLGSGTY